MKFNEVNYNLILINYFHDTLCNGISNLYQKTELY